MSSQEIDQESSPTNEQQLSLKDNAILDLLKNTNFEEFNAILKQLKNGNITTNQDSPNSNKQAKQIEQISGKENMEIFRPQKHDKLYINDVITMQILPNQRTIEFGNCFPGNVLEQPILLKNIGYIAYKIKITVLCYDEELNELDEYVFSIRKDDDYEYNENQLAILQPNCEEEFFVALKAPNLKQERKINGIVQVKVIGGGLCGIIEKSINTFVQLPKVVCLKELFSQDYQQSVIKLAMKLSNNIKCECKVPFKNISNIDAKVEFELIYDKSRDDEYEFNLNSSLGMIQSNTLSMIGLIGKKLEKKHSMKIRPGLRSQLYSQLEKITRKKSRKKDMKSQEQSSKNLIILIKVINSSLIFCYPTIVEIY